ncbi:ABC transporter ATP-binding protein [Candidatus Methylospira mobilis]|uniref:ABC transporter ATP-binding protein n=1 Tax=Candidatus Methylospira mobilis TaxID=1808979 RepID=A0A5Q0BJX3_9GAMM|nr:ABC transporter ATP-binding protein [Candidatus Methylospira mobilis]QFY42106.1 ABC transporter ATP-binding protein [Candidatus Methylospira mobilis]
MASITFEHIAKIYPNSHNAIKDFSLSIDDGEFMVLVGPSGCGKSTLLRILAGLETATSGRILIDNEVANELTPQTRNIAMVFQDYALYPNMTVRGNLEFPLKMRGLPRAAIRSKVEEIVQLLNIEALVERLPKELSGGQRQRVAMGRALVRNPRAFLMDEPLSNLDAKLRTQMRSEIGELQRRTGATMIYVTHDQVEAMTLGHRIAVIDQGCLLQVDTPSRLYRYPANPFVAGFIGNPPMNLFNGAAFVRNGDINISLGSQQILAAQVVPGAMSITQLAQQTTVGIRPEALHLWQEGDINRLTGRVDLIEHLGHETLVYFTLDDDAGAPDTMHRAAVARIPGNIEARTGSTMAFGVASAAITLYPA